MNKFVLGPLGMLLLVLHTPLAAAPGDWTIQKSSDGLAQVKSRITKQPAAGGKEVLILESVATTEGPGDLRRCIAMMKDLNRHKGIVDAAESFVVRPLSETRWVIYYRFNVPWPLQSLDLAATMELEEHDQKSAQFTVSATPDLAPAKTGVLRMSVYDLRYSFTDLGGGRIGLTVTSKSSPSMDVPEWMLRGYYPDGPAEVLKNILKEAQK